MTNTYCPKDLNTDYEEFGLVKGTAVIRKIEITFVRTPDARSDSVKLLLHGVGGSWVSWTPMLGVAKAADVPLGDILVVDIPGFGDSQRALKSLDIDAVGDAVIELALSLGWTHVDLIGHSMGGFLALNMAASRHASLDSVSIISGAYFSIVETGQHPIRALRRNPAAAFSYASLRALSSVGPIGPWMAKMAYRIGVLPLFLRTTVAHPRQLKPRILKSMSESINPKSFLMAAKNGRTYDPIGKWSQIVIPVKAIFGKHDQLVPPADMLQLKMLVPTAEAKLLPNAGHFSHVESPAEVLQFFFDA